MTRTSSSRGRFGRSSPTARDATWLIPEVTYPLDRPKRADLDVLVMDSERIERRVEEVKKRFADLFGA